jgi:hypothetical protein
LRHHRCRTVISLAPIMLGGVAIRNGRHQGGRSGRMRMFGGAAGIVVALAIGFFILDSAVGTGPAILPALVPSVLAVFDHLPRLLHGRVELSPGDR